ncbi:hypothetical protein ACTXT7_000099 [Hymenolepis weldensis]
MTVLEFRTNIFSKASKFGWKKKLNRTKLQEFLPRKDITDKCCDNLLIEKVSVNDSPRSITELGIYTAHSFATSKSNSLDDIEKQFPILSSLLDEEDDWIPPSKRKNSTTLYETEDKLKNTSNRELFVQ